MPKEKILCFEFAKAVGIILVVYGHVVRGVHSAGIEMNDNVYTIVDNIIYSFHMPLFFFISGLFFGNSLVSRGRIGLVANKIDTLAYPYIIWSLLQGGIELVLSQFTNGSVTVAEVLSLLWMPRAQFWFFYILFLIFLIAVVAYRTQSPWILWGIFIVSTVLKFFANAIPEVVHLPYISHYMIYFAFGAALKNYIPNLLKHHFRWTILSGVLALAGQYCLNICPLPGNNYAFVLRPAVAIVSIVFIICLSSVLASIRKIHWISIVGQKSLHIYVMHVLIGSGIRIGLQKFLHISDPAIHIAVGCLGGILLPVWLMLQFSSLSRIGLFSAPAFLSAERQFARRIHRKT